MRILLINDYSKMVGGTEKTVFNLEKALKKRNHVVEIFGHKGNENFASLFSRWYSIKWYKKTIQKIKRFKPDIVHVNNCFLIISPSVINASLNMGIPVILTFHDLHYVCPRVGGLYEKDRPKKYKGRHICFHKSCAGFREEYKDIPNNIWKLLKLILHRKIIKNKKINFASPSKFIADMLEDSLRIKSRVMMWGTDIPKKETTYKKNIIFVGEINVEKGLGTIADILNKIKGYNIFILGKGPLKKTFENKYKNIKFLGFQNPEKYQKEASIFLMPSIWQEGGGLSVTEAMSYGICTIGSNIGGIPEQVKHMETGLLFEPGNKKDFEKQLNYLLNNPNEIKRMGKNAREFVKRNCSSKSLAERYEDLYLKAIQKNKTTKKF